jgi:hypothetical protein
MRFVGEALPIASGRQTSGIATFFALFRFQMRLKFDLVKNEIPGSMGSASVTHPISAAQQLNPTKLPESYGG